jgi:hypothetical protein
MEIRYSRTEKRHLATHCPFISAGIKSIWLALTVKDYKQVLRRTEMTITTRKIPDDFLAESDKTYIAEIVTEYLQENEIEVGSYSFQLEVTFEQEN